MVEKVTNRTVSLEQTRRIISGKRDGDANSDSTVNLDRSSDVVASAIIISPATSLPQLVISQGRKKYELANEVREKHELEKPEDKSARIKKVDGAKKLAEELWSETVRLSSLSEAHRNTKYKTLEKLAAERTDKEALELRELTQIKKQRLKLTSSNMKREDYSKFFNTLNYVLTRTNRTKLLEDTELVALTAYYYGVNHLASLPDNFLKNLPNCRTILAKHFFFDLKGKKSARDVEKFEGWQEIGKLKFRPILGNTRPCEIAELICEGCTQGENPMVRDWSLSHPDMWQGDAGKDRALRAMAWVLEFGEGVFIRDKERQSDDEPSGTLDLEAIKKTDWTSTLYDYGLKGMLACCPATPDTATAIKLGAEKLVGKGTPVKTPRYHITRSGMWTETNESGWRLIDDVTDDVIEKLRTTNPELFEERETVDSKRIRGKGKLVPKEVRKFDGWFKTYNDTASDCLRNSEMNLYEALKRRHNYLCGFGKNQVKEWGITHHKWEGPKGKELFRQSVAYSFRDAGRKDTEDNGLGRFYIEDNVLYFTFDISEFDNWYKKEIKAKHENDLREFLTKRNLSGGLREVAKDNVHNLIKILFGMDDNAELPKVRCQTKDQIKETIKAVLKTQGDTFKMSFGKINEEDKAILIAEGVTVKKSKADNLIPVLYAPVEAPFQHGFISFAQTSTHRQGLTINSLERFDSRGTKLGRVLSSLDTGFPISKMADVLVSNIVSGNCESGTSIERLLLSRIFRSGRGYDLSQDDIKQILASLQNILDDINFNPLSGLRDELRMYLGEMNGLQGDIREKLILITNAGKVQDELSSTSGKLRKIEVLNQVIDHIAKTVIVRAVNDKSTGLDVGKVYPFEFLQRALPPVAPQVEDNAQRIATRIEKNWRKGNSLLGVYGRRNLDEIRSEARRLEATGDIEDIDFADVLLKIADRNENKDEGIELEKTTTTHDRFSREIEQAASRLFIPDVANNIEIESLVAWHLKEKGRGQAKTGFLNDFPDGFLNPTDENFLPRLSRMLAYAMAT